MSQTDIVTLQFPRNSKYYTVARLVVGGMAAPLDMSYDALDDLQLAISSLLDSEDLPINGDGELTLHIEVADDRMQASLGAFEEASVDAAFERSREQGGDFNLRRLLDTIVDGVEVSSRGDGEWVTLTKRVRATV